MVTGIQFHVVRFLNITPACTLKQAYTIINAMVEILCEKD